MRALELVSKLLMDEKNGDSPIDTANFLPFLARGPLLKAPLVDIVSAGGLAPDNVLDFRFKFCEADRTIA